MRKMPLISVIIPIYNGEKYIKKCVESFVGQSYKNIEIILVNDGSRDNSERIIKQLAAEDDRIVLISQKNAGVSTARNRGMDIASGEYVCFADADDVVSPNYVSYLYDLIRRRDAEISVVSQPVNFVGDGIGIFDKDFDSDSRISVYRGIDAAKDLLYYKIKMSCWSKLFQRSFLNKHDIRFHESLICGEGFHFCTECFIKARKVAIGYQAIYGYRLDNPNSAMTKFNIELIRNGLRAIEMIEHTIDHYNELEGAYHYAKWHTNCDFLNMIVGCEVKNQYKEEYFAMKRRCSEMADYAIWGPVSRKDKLKGMMYKINPYFTAKGINRLRARKFKTIEENACSGGGGARHI